ncbi:bacillithiol biosynthesis BshC [Bacillus carboniphilus]|uniref:Bacillithiol biosynthesis BshC n=1 Tax=Bacillus carboniphilus TaxID=86663 RepID=A0ABY9JYN8_9BACI|nr:bacillithiol biosynthesis BshC [Bacillus carboniphilus]WLR43633.1 bacillithiol biosynthesis BshC [Bacillus carboniphilus]
MALSHHNQSKQMISSKNIDQEVCMDWIDELLSTYGETEFTNVTRAQLFNALQKSGTYSDFFHYIIFDLFKDTGLVLCDSASPKLRTVEVPFFEKIIKKSKHINETLSIQQKELVKNGFKTIIDSEPNSSQLFFIQNKERELLLYNEKNLFQLPNKQEFTDQELIELLKKHPAKFSNNVVTRPIMQECIFPTLAFYSWTR